MNTTDEFKYVKRTQKDYSMSFKLQVVQEIEQGEIGFQYPPIALRFLCHIYELIRFTAVAPRNQPVSCSQRTIRASRTPKTALLQSTSKYSYLLRL